MAITTILLDLDGVVRHFDPAHLADVERRHGVDQGALTAAAFSPELLTPAITGQVDRATWVANVGRATNHPEAALEWLSMPATVDWDVVADVDELRSKDFTVAVLTNGTTETQNEVSDAGLLEHFDAIFSTADIGFAKPDPRAFSHVCGSLGVEPDKVFFTDDSESKLSGAIEIGMTVRRFVDRSTFHADLAACGLPTLR